MKLSGPGYEFFRRFLTMKSVSVIVKGLLKLSIEYLVSFDNLASEKFVI